MEEQLEAQQGEARKWDISSRHPSGMVPESRGSSVASVQAEPLTLDEDELQDAKEAAEYLLKTNDPETAEQLFGLTRKEIVQSTEAAALALSAKINELVEKAEQVVEANKISQDALVKIPGTAAAEAAKNDSNSDSLTSNVPHQQDLGSESHPHSD